MTVRQIAETLGCNAMSVHKAFADAGKEHPEIKQKTDTAKHIKGGDADYTLDEVLSAMAYFREGKGINEIEKILITEDFTIKPPEKVKAIGIDGTEEFLEKVKKGKAPKCCSTCSFCTKATMRNRKPVLKPFCNFWERFLHRLNANPYKDYCKQWELSDKEPLIFYKANSPANVDIYGNIRNEVMGFDNKVFRKKGEGLVTDVGLDI